jgi:uncharacterized protein
MRKKIQQQSGSKEQSPQATLGIVSITEARGSDCSPSNDSTEIHHDCKTAGGPEGFADTVKKGSNDRGVMAFFSISGIMILMVVLYQKIISPWLPVACRFSPTCSHYAIEALKIHGVFKGSALTLWRLLRCQPFCRGGSDPVPLAKSNIKKGSNSEI